MDDLTWSYFGIYFNSSSFVPSLIFSVESDEPEDKQVKTSGNDCETEQNEDEHKGHVFGFIRQGVVLLKCNHISKADSCQRDETVVNRVEIGPSFVFGEGGRTSRNGYCRYGRHYQDQISL